MGTSEAKLFKLEDCGPTKVEDVDFVKLERVDEVMPKVEDEAEKLYRMLDVTKQEFAFAEARYSESITVKPESQDTKSPESLMDELERPRKRPRLVPVVLLPTLAEVRRRTGQVEDVEEVKKDYKKLKLLKNPEVKKRSNMEFILATMRRRLKPIGLDIQSQYFTLDQATREAQVTRMFMSKTYGGNSQQTYPSIGAEFLAIHGMNDFMYINKQYQAEAPELPGAPGLFFCSGEHPSWIRRVLVRLKPGIWQYLGQYQMARSYIPFLTKEEWAAEPKKLRDTWAKVLLKSWGDNICARIRGRKDLGREPTIAEVNDVIESGRYKLTTPQEVMAALDAGTERLTVWTLKCVGYDNDFQRQLSEKFPVWKQQQKKKKKKAEQKPAQQGNSVPRGKKRKRADTPESEETDEGEDEVDDDDE